MSTRVEAAPEAKGLERALLSTFVVAALVNLGGQALGGSGLPPVLLAWLNHLSKPVLIPALAGLFVVRARDRQVRVHRGWLFAALLFCWGGDVALMFSGFFLPGMAAFALAHVLFLLGYTRGLSARALLRPDTLLFVLPLVAYGYLLYPTLVLSLPEDQSGMALPLAGYMVVLLANGTTCLFRALQGIPGAPRVLVGAVLFILSDSLIAMNQFVHALPGAGFAYMLTYIVGVYGMVQGGVPLPGEGLLRERADG